MEAYKPSKADYFWNMSGCLASAMASLLLVIGVTRIMGTEAGGIFSLAFSLGQLLMMLGNMGLRTYQVSDLEERYSMGEYVVNRIISCALMMLCTCVYGIATRCSGEKFAALLLIVGTKMIDAFADVFEGQLQKEHRLDLAGISMTIRMAVTTLLCLGLLMVTRQLMVACGCMFLGAVFCLAAFSVVPALRVHRQRGVLHRQGISLRKSIALFVPAIPLFFSSFGLMMIAGMPKYAIDFLMTESAQAIYGILYLPAQVVSLLSNFIFKPLIAEMAYDWQHGLKERFVRRIRKLLVFIAAGDGVILLGTWLLGIPVLNLFSGLELDAYLADLLILVAGGAFTAAAALLFQAITIMRRQTVAFGIYIVVTAVSAALDLLLIRSLGLLGASIGYMTQTMLLAISLYVVYAIGYKKDKKPA